MEKLITLLPSVLNLIIPNLWKTIEKIDDTVEVIKKKFETDIKLAGRFAKTTIPMLKNSLDQQDNLHYLLNKQCLDEECRVKIKIIVQILKRNLNRDGENINNDKYSGKISRLKELLNQTKQEITNEAIIRKIKRKILSSSIFAMVAYFALQEVKYGVLFEIVGRILGLVGKKLSTSMAVVVLIFQLLFLFFNDRTNELEKKKNKITKLLSNVKEFKDIEDNQVNTNDNINFSILRVSDCLIENSNRESNKNICKELCSSIKLLLDLLTSVNNFLIKYNASIVSLKISDPQIHTIKKFIVSDKYTDYLVETEVHINYQFNYSIVEF